MKFLHLADLHLGKRVCEFSMIDDQRAILEQLRALAEKERVDAVLLAGDIYDKPSPSAEAVALFDDFLTGLADLGVEVFAISGNHDSAERLAFGARLMSGRGVFLSRAFSGRVECFSRTDAYGEVQIVLLPFVRPLTVRRFFEGQKIESYTDAVRAALQTAELHPDARRVLVAHQFVAGSARCDSEEISAGGLDAVESAAFAGFDYVALGHLHGPQSAGAPFVRYCGSPLKYSLSEAGQQKSATLVELRQKGEAEVRTLPLAPVRDLRVIRGSYMELTARETYQGTAVGDYLHAVLTDENEVPEALGRLRAIYPNIMSLAYDNARTRAVQGAAAEPLPALSPEALFCELYERQNGGPMQPEQQEVLRQIVNTVWEEEA